jgi:hypothetical protein
VLVFVATKHAAEMVADKLRKARIYAEPFHGELSQGAHAGAGGLQGLAAKVVTHRLAARGLDIANCPPSSTSICRDHLLTMSTALAAPDAPARLAWR